VGHFGPWAMDESGFGGTRYTGREKVADQMVTFYGIGQMVSSLSLKNKNMTHYIAPNPK